MSCISPGGDLAGFSDFRCTAHWGEPCLNHLYAELKAFAARTGLYVHMTGLTRGLLSWESSAAFSAGNLSDHEHHVCSFLR